MRSFASGRISYYSLIYHLGRRSGKEYATPVVAVKNERYIYISLPYGTDTDWFLNVQAAGHCQVKIKGQVYDASRPQIIDAAAAASAFPIEFQKKIEKTTLNQFLRLSTLAEQ